MSVSKQPRHGHEWTVFQKHTLLCLMAKNMHITGAVRGDGSSARNKFEAYMDVSTAFNDALHSARYGEDIPYEAVRDMIDQLLKEKKGVLGPGGAMERLVGSRITRTRKLAWERTDKRDFLGTVEEWKGGRRWDVMNNYREERGLPLLPSSEKFLHTGRSPRVRHYAGRFRSRDRNTAGTGSQDAEGIELASFIRLPAALQSDPRFRWAKAHKKKTDEVMKHLARPDDYTDRNPRYKSDRVAGAKGRESGWQGVPESPAKRRQYRARALAPVGGLLFPLIEEETGLSDNIENFQLRTPILASARLENMRCSASTDEVPEKRGGATGSVAWEKTFGTVLTNQEKNRNVNIEDGEMWGNASPGS